MLARRSPLAARRSPLAGSACGVVVSVASLAVVSVALPQATVPQYTPPLFPPPVQWGPPLPYHRPQNIEPCIGFPYECLPTSLEGTPCQACENPLWQSMCAPTEWDVCCTNKTNDTPNGDCSWVMEDNCNVNGLCTGFSAVPTASRCKRIFSTINLCP